MIVFLFLFCVFFAPSTNSKRSWPYTGQRTRHYSTSLSLQKIQWNSTRPVTSYVCRLSLIHSDLHVCCLPHTFPPSVPRSLYPHFPFPTRSSSPLWFTSSPSYSLSSLLLSPTFFLLIRSFLLSFSVRSSKPGAAWECTNYFSLLDTMLKMGADINSQTEVLGETRKCMFTSCQMSDAHGMSCCAVLRHVVSYRHVFSCHMVSCRVMLCMSCHVASCHVISCRVMSCHVTPFQIFRSVKLASCYIITLLLLLFLFAALMQACQRGNVNAVRFLIQNKVKWNIRNK